MQQRAEAKWFVYMVVFLVVYCGFLFAFRAALVNVEAKTQLSLFKPEPAQIAVMAWLILLFHFSFIGLYSFSLGGRWQRMATVIVCLLITGAVLYGFNEWFKATSNPFFQFANTGALPWYAREKPKFLIANLPLVVFIVFVFVFRIFMIFKPAQ